MNLKSFIFFVLIGAVSLSPVAAQNISNFGPSIGYGPLVNPGNTWSYNGTTSTVSGTNSNGNVLLGTFENVTDFSGANQISLTATTGNAAPGSSFLFTLYGQSGQTASAVFAWPSFLSPGATVTAPLTPIVPSTLQNVNSWQIVATYNDGAPPEPINVTFSNANASFGTAPTPGIGGPLVAGFGAAATSAGTWTYNPGTSSISGNLSYGDSITGNTSVTNFGNNPTQISMTASANVALGVPFTYVLTDNTGDQAYAAFNWANFNGGTKTVTSQLTTTPFFDPTNVVNWQILSGAENTAVNATLYGVAAVSPTQTDTVIDDFSVGVSQFLVSNNSTSSANSTINVAGFTNAQRQIEESVLLNGLAEVSVNGGIYSLAATNAPETTNTIEYSNFTIYATEQHFLRFDFNIAQGLDELVVELLNGSRPLVGGIFAVPNSGGPSSYFIDLSLLPNWTPEFASGIDQMRVVFGSTNPNLLVELDKISFTSIPEPSTWALLALGGAMLIWRLVRRRRSAARGES